MSKPHTAGDQHPHHEHHDHDDHDHSAHAHAGHDHAGHDHSSGAHSHAPSVTEANEKRIRIVFIMTAAYAAVQAVGGWMSGSLALIADAGHMVSDAAALLLALIAYRVAARAPDALRTYGFHRVRVLAALANGAALLLLVAWIAWEAIARFRSPTTVLAGPMLIVAVIGLFVNLTGAYVLLRGNQGDGNLRGALLHVLGDLLGSVGAIAAAIGIMLTGWTLLDPILSVLVAVLVVRSAWGLVSDSVFILLQGTPKGMDIKAVEADIASLPGIAEVGHLHAWTLTDESIVATIHVTPQSGSDPLALPALVVARLKDKHAVEHATVQVDPPGGIQKPCADGTC